MGHGIGGGPVPPYEPEPQPQNQGVTRRLEDEILADNEIIAQENLGDNELTRLQEWQTESGIAGEVVENGDEDANLAALQDLILSAAGDHGIFGAPVGYYMSPMDVALLVKEEILTVEEARSYLQKQGIELG